MTSSLFKLFNIFKSKLQTVDLKKIEKDFHTKLLPIFKAVVDKLPGQYSFLKTRFDEKLLRGYVKNGVKDGTDFYVFLIDQELHKKFETDKNNFLLHNIKIFSNHLKDFAKLKLHINDNLPIAFEFSDKEWDFDISQIDTSELKRLDYDNTEYQKWVKTIGKVPADLRKSFDIISGFEIEIQGDKFFTIKEFGDGDYIAIKETGQIFGLIHGSNKIDKLFDNIDLMYLALHDKSFSFESYYTNAD
jgi:hypothetical protein